MHAPNRQTLLVNGRFLGRTLTGVDRFALEMLKALDTLIGVRGLDLQLEVAVPRGTHTELQLAHGHVLPVGTRQGHLWEQLDLRRHAHGNPLVNLCNTGPVGCANSHVVIHDAAVFSLPQAYGWRFRWAYRVLHTLLARLGPPPLTVSRFSQQELSRHLGLNADQITVLPESGEHMLQRARDPSILRQHQLTDRPFVLAVSSNHLGKNFHLLAQALQGLPDAGFDVVVAGGSNHRVFADQTHTLPAFVKRVGYVSDEQLCSLYQHAACFVFPSIYEGFGLPPLEAMSLGCPVVAAHAASIPEVCGDAAIYFDPYNADSLRQALLTVMQEGPAARAARSARALQHAHLWRWQDAAAGLLAHLKAQNVLELAPCH